jgi:hypothetical protein
VAILDPYKPAIQRVLDRSAPGWNADGIIAEVLQGRAQLFEIGPDNIIVTQLKIEPRGVTCLIWLAAGELKPLLEKHEEIKQWARDQGCNYMRIIGRIGWEKMLKDYKKIAIVMELEL